jgi:hypothetical protein
MTIILLNQERNSNQLKKKKDIASKSIVYNIGGKFDIVYDVSFGCVVLM